MPFEIVPTRLQGPLLIQPRAFGDPRGFFAETFRADQLAELGLPTQDFVQDNHSRSTQGVVRGMHFALGGGMSKLVRCGRGRILDVVVDVRPWSKTFGEWEAHELDEESLRIFWIPTGFAHGFCVLSEIADVLYKQTAYYDPGVERGIAYDDPAVGIAWPQGFELLVSERDAAAPLLAEMRDELPADYGR